MKTKLFFVTLVLAALAASVRAADAMEMDLWQNDAPSSNGDAADKAKVWVYLPEASMATGRAVVICPGGAYGFLAMDHEGHQWAKYFNAQGVAAVVLKYRMPHGHWLVPAEDAEEAIRMVRRHAAEWNIKQGEVGIMGSSAGGHLATTVATHATGDAAPNFQILLYPVVTMDAQFTHQGSRENLLGKSPDKKLVAEYSNELHVSGSTPRAFIAFSSDDTAVWPENSVQYYLQLCHHHVPVMMHSYPTGGHGWGFNADFKYHAEVLMELKAWLASF